ncbi:uncharacterized protein LOC112126758 [Cimex lectularius]|uniref:Tetraspanin n=1 Tax=Cimex lectularius TaxID=79782 RepID=A0A8I6TJH4_CIMLE|nr:uncharacterized protein LOC112126758 [Cimex lectularius]
MYLYFAREIAGIIEQTFMIICTVAMVMSIITVPVSCIAFNGVSKKSKTLMRMYAVVFLITAVLKLIAGLFTFYVYPEAQCYMKQRIKLLYNRTFHYNEMINFIQVKFKCCGDFSLETWGALKLPVSCCPPSITGPCVPNKAYTVACYDAIRVQTKKRFKIIGWLCVCAFCLEVVCAALACAVICNIKPRMRRAISRPRSFRPA